MGGFQNFQEPATEKQRIHFVDSIDNMEQVPVTEFILIPAKHDSAAEAAGPLKDAISSFKQAEGSQRVFSGRQLENPDIFVVAVGKLLHECVHSHLNLCTISSVAVTERTHPFFTILVLLTTRLHPLFYLLTVTYLPGPGICSLVLALRINRVRHLPGPARHHLHGDGPPHGLVPRRQDRSDALGPDHRGLHGLRR